MRRKEIIVIACIIVGAVCLTAVFKSEIKSTVVRMITYELEREREKEVGEYNILSWNDGKFQINHYSSGSQLNMIENEKTIVLMEGVIDFKEKNDRLYIITSGDQAVIDRNDIAYIHIENSRYDPDNDIEIESNGKTYVYSSRYESDSIVYLESVSEFFEADQEIFFELSG